jgi:gamma-glutamylcyclotransferase (GGCT)/AIG2-like uncharacterized protein YtfP
VIDVPAGTAHHLFVYGTLRDEARLRDVHGDGGAWSHLGPATVAGDLYDAGAYPGLLLRDDGEPSVEGKLVELFDPVVAFTALDAYEEVDAGLYARRQCRARLMDGSEHVVWVYEYNRSVSGLPRLRDTSGRSASWENRPTRQLERRS